MSQEYLDFELPIAELEAKIEALRSASDDKIDLHDEIKRLQKKSDELTKKTFANLDAWQVSRMARHPNRPYTLDYIEHIFTDFQELAGDRAFADDKAIVGGLARLDGRAVMIIGHQKGRTVKDKVTRNFGMPAPEGYRKALRLMQMAERFNLPIITFIDTPGAYPGIGAEERGQGEAIARGGGPFLALQAEQIEFLGRRVGRHDLDLRCILYSVDVQTRYFWCDPQSARCRNERHQLPRICDFGDFGGCCIGHGSVSASVYRSGASSGKRFDCPCGTKQDLRCVNELV